MSYKQSSAPPYFNDRLGLNSLTSQRIFTEHTKVNTPKRNHCDSFRGVLILVLSAKHFTDKLVFSVLLYIIIGYNKPLLPFSINVL